MDLFQASYALGSISAARSSLASAQRALERGDGARDSESNDRASAALGKALSLLEMAIHELGAEIAAHQLSGLRPRNPTETANDESWRPRDIKRLKSGGSGR